MSDTKEKIIDKLDRHEFIKFIENLIVNSDNYKREDDTKSYVMAIDSAWGTGKSYFIDLLIQNIEEENNIFVVKYNAWANDYCDNAFNPLIYDILKSDAIVFDIEKDSDKKNLKNLLISIGKIGLSLGKQAFTKKIKKDYGLEIDKAVDEAIKAGKHIKDFMFRITENLEQLNVQRDSFEELKSSLRLATQGMQDAGKKLVVIIDELDRCKPTFAIQTLEIVKHIFDVENIVFLFAVDIEQLSHSISSVYGDGFDSVGYLCRFFDYISKLPNPKIEKFISYKLEEAGFDRQHPDIIETHKYICELVHKFELSLRDVDTIIQSYKILSDTKLKEYRILGAHFVYLFYLTLKYKRPDIYREIFIKNENLDDYCKKIENNYSFTVDEEVYIRTSILALNNNAKLGTLPRDMYNGSRKEYIRVIPISTSDNEMKIKGDHRPLSINEFSIWGNILFYPDLLKWEEIANYTYRDHIHKQLENYDFVDFNLFMEKNDNNPIPIYKI